MPLRRLALVTALLAGLVCGRAAAAPGLRDEGDRNAFRAWFTLLADAQFERRTPDVIDCASLVRHAYREALRPHTPEWRRRSGLPLFAAIPDVREKPPVDGAAWLLFRVAREPDRYAEFADAATIVSLNARLIGRDVRAAQPGDLLFFRQNRGSTPHHLMVFVGESRFERQGRDWLVYHTGPDEDGSGEVRKVSATDLTKHPAPRWRPVRNNDTFVGVFRLNILDRER